jgi:hypothetical protein
VQFALRLLPQSPLSVRCRAWVARQPDEIKHLLGLPPGLSARYDPGASLTGIRENLLRMHAIGAPVRHRLVVCYTISAAQ